MSRANVTQCTVLVDCLNVDGQNTGREPVLAERIQLSKGPRKFYGKRKGELGWEAGIL